MSFIKNPVNSSYKKQFAPCKNRSNRFLSFVDGNIAILVFTRGISILPKPDFKSKIKSSSIKIAVFSSRNIKNGFGWFLHGANCFLQLGLAGFFPNLIFSMGKNYHNAHSGELKMCITSPVKYSQIRWSTSPNGSIQPNGCFRGIFVDLHIEYSCNLQHSRLLSSFWHSKTGNSISDDNCSAHFWKDFGCGFDQILLKLWISSPTSDGRNSSLR